MSINWRRAGLATTIIISGILIFLLSLLIIISLMLTTERGTRITLNLAERFAPGELSITHQSGSLLRDLRIANVSFTQPGSAIDIEDLQFDWQPRALMARTFHVNTLSFSRMSLVLEPSEEDEAPADTEFELPDIELPIDIKVDSLDLANIHLQIGEFEQVIDEVQLRASSVGYEQHIEHLLVRVEQGEVRGQGTIETRDNYPLDINLEAEFALPDMRAIQAELALVGDLEALQVTLRTQGLVDSEVEAQLAQVLDIDELSWDAQVLLKDIRHEALQDSIHALDFELHSQGNLARFGIELDGNLESAEQGEVDISAALVWNDRTLTIEQFDMSAEEMISSVTVTGYAVISDVLDIDISGDAEAFGFSQNQFSLRATGTQDGAEHLELSLNLPQGSATLNGSIGWAPYLSWDLNIRVDELNFAEISDELQGDLKAQIATQGRFDDVLELQASINELQGSLMDYTISGRGDVNIQGDHFQANNLDIIWGETRIRADGQYSPEGINLSFLVDIPELASLLPQAGGQLSARGDVTGSEEQPQLNIQVRGSELFWQTYRLDDISADVEADGTLTRLPTGNVLLSGIQAEGQTIERLAVRMRQQQQHQTEIDVDYDQLEMRVALHGDWQREEQEWQGTINRLQLRYPDIGRWNVTQPAPLRVSPEQFALDDFCLIISTRESELCAQAQWQAASGDFDFEVRAEAIPYQLFSAFLPEDVNILGEFNVIADVNQTGDELNADVRLTISDTSVRVPAQELRVDFDSGELFRLVGNQQQLEAQLRILSDQLEGGAEGNATINDVLDDTRSIDGEIGIDVRSFVLLSVLMPEIQNVAGHMNGRVDFAGQLDDLTIGGGLELRDGSAEIPATGLQLRNLNLVIQAPTGRDEPFILEGAVDAGEGQLDIDGAYYLTAQRAELNIQGAAFPALNTRELQVTIAPDLSIVYTPELLRLRGAVDVPYARITPPDFESVDSISNDTVIVSGDGGPYEQNIGGLPIDMDLTVNLGDDVQVSAFGFEGRLQGGLRIIEQTGQETTAVGNIDVASGAYEIYGQALNIERGRLIFTGGPVANPGLDLRVERSIDAQSVTVGARVGGTLENPTLNLFSSPTMQDSAILSYLLFGRGPGQGSSGEQNMLARATLALGMSGGNRLGERLSDTLGVDEISLDSGDTFESTALFIGKQLSSRLYIKYGMGLIEPVSTFFIQYRLTDNLNFESRTSNEQSGADLFFTIER
ncbi:translocation/assembly module TamB domain-containing protein [Aliidiomarina maris]|uniref:Autotransporter translocation and assembly factor TamB n=1 Tax=Aliidiomarina maris TaxID=531312 RepID=A0A327WWT1_9GAMM|nr:translocation/assembly module TamB domain-containing protein [Aliidiomarina maris]RAJ96425.1 autotransporter translocation and assembly factor TamB [Aliidiomarina maris]RUO22800.1 hypothetical protein CWE07_09980 [Aliidiomarina maris]